MTVKNLFSIFFLISVIVVFAGFGNTSHSSTKPAKKPNILFIAVDDLKPWVTAYGDVHAKTPGMDKLAKEGMVFKNAYCQQAICAASRASIMTGMRPDKTKVWDLVTDFRQVNPKAVSIPEYFKSNGYETAGMGKIYHKESAGPGHDAASWSIPYRDPKTVQWALPFDAKENGRGPAVECTNVPDYTYHDGKMTEMAINLLDSLSKNEKPFFLAVGFLKPHLPFIAPKKYWDLYERNEFELAPFQKMAKNSPEIAYHQSGELKNYSDIPEFNNYSTNELDHLPANKQRELIHGYYACISYTDAQILQLLDKLDHLGIRENTIIVLWGDHGWHLGDHGLWNKHTNFEQATHALLMMSVPRTKAGIQPSTQSEFVDVFPTLCELSELPIPKYLDGVSLVPAMKNPDSELREYAFSQYPRGKNIMGYSIRTKRFRYTEWCNDDFKTNMPYNKKHVVAREMYDYEKDYLETENVVDKPEYQKESKEMEALFLKSMNREYESCTEFSKIANYQTLLNTSRRKNK